MPLSLCTLPYWSNQPFLISDIRALSPERQSTRMSKTKNGGLDQYGAKPFEQQQFGTAGVEVAKWLLCKYARKWSTLFYSSTVIQHTCVSFSAVTLLVWSSGL